MKHVSKNKEKGKIVQFPTPPPLSAFGYINIISRLSCISFNTEAASPKLSLWQLLQNDLFSQRKKEFLQSLEWYKSKPELLDSMYQNILSEIAILHSKKVE